MKSNNTIKHISINKHATGSILFFTPALMFDNNNHYLGPTLAQKVITSYASIFNPKDIYSASFLTHVAIICSQESGQLYIAHATQLDHQDNSDEAFKKNHEHKLNDSSGSDSKSKSSILGYVKETLISQVTRDFDRSFFAFTPHGESIFAK